MLELIQLFMYMTSFVRAKMFNSSFHQIRMYLLRYKRAACRPSRHLHQAAISSQRPAGKVVGPLETLQVHSQEGWGPWCKAL